MPNFTYGLIVEGPYDVPVYEELIRKIVPTVLAVVPRAPGGKTKLASNLRSLLFDLEHAIQGRPVDKVIVVRDSNGKNSSQVEGQLAQKAQVQSFSFPRGIKFHAVRRSVETWLLADAAAISSTAASRGGQPVSDVHGELEEIENPKDKFISLLSSARLPHDPAVRREIAAQLRLERLRYRCPSFCSFETKLIDC